MGKVVQGTLECPYHGWRMQGSGQVIHVPALPAFKPPAEHRACAYAARIAYGLIWVALTAHSELPADAAPPVFAAEDDDHLRKLNTGPYEVMTSAPRIVENFLIYRILALCTMAGSARANRPSSSLIR